MELGVVQYNQTSNNTYSSTTSFSNSSTSATPTSCVPSSVMATQTTTTTIIGPTTTTTNNHLRNPHHHEGDGKINPYQSSSSNAHADQNSPYCLLICLAFLFPPLAMAMLMKYHLKHPMDTSDKVKQMIVSFMLTMLCYIPGVLHVVFAILQELTSD